MGNLVTCEELARHLGDPSWAVFDCRHDLAEPDKGLREYGKGHIPGALHAHMDRDLSGPVGDGRKGRHPQPLPGVFSRWLGQRGVGPDTTVVLYDDQGGQWAGRLWWMLRDHGHAKAFLLDGGLTRWKSLRLALSERHETPRKPITHPGKPGQMPALQADAIAAAPPGALRLLDARAPERYRGEVEPIDKRAGHIPGAVNLPFADLTAPDRTLLPPERLRERFAAAGIATAQGAACYCGSGVTSALLVLAAEEAGLGTLALYPGSWSEWSWPQAGRAAETGTGTLAAQP